MFEYLLECAVNLLADRLGVAPEITHCRCDLFMPQEFLGVFNLDAVLPEVLGPRVPEFVRV